LTRYATWREVNVYYLSVKGSIKLGVNFIVMFHSTNGNDFCSKTGSSTASLLCGSTVGYPSDSLASCYISYSRKCLTKAENWFCLVQQRDKLADGYEIWKETVKTGAQSTSHSLRNTMKLIPVKFYVTSHQLTSRTRISGLGQNDPCGGKRHTTAELQGLLFWIQYQTYGASVFSL